MTRREASAGIRTTAALAATPSVAISQNLKPIELPPPRSEGGQALRATLKLRRSTREYSDRPLPMQTLSDLLGQLSASIAPRAAIARSLLAPCHGDGHLRCDGRRVWRYEPKSHTLLPHSKDDIRAQTGLQDFVGTAPLDLVYVGHGELLRESNSL